MLGNSSCKGRHKQERGFVLTGWLAGILICLAISNPAQAQDCTSFSQQINSAYQSSNAKAALSAFKQAEASHLCSANRLAILGRFAALTQLKASKSAPADQRIRLLEQSLKTGRPWQILATLGDLEKSRADYMKAVAYYQQALDDINDEVFNPKAPGNATIAAIYQKAVIARSLAGRYARTTSSRSGEPGGLARVKFRGFSVRKIPAPVQFAYNSTEFTQKGKMAVSDMFDYLTRQGSPDIQLTGHTDAKGSDKYNLKLSQRRAEAVKQYLLTHNYTGNITTTGHGEAEPFKLDDPALYTTEQIDQLNRRVEIERR